MRSRRALLYMPGDDMKKIQKATTLGVDCICMDMEDGVAANRKAEARTTILEALRTLDFGRAEKQARINPVGSDMEQEDLNTVLPGHPDAIVVPKVEEGEQVRWVSEQIAEFERQQGWPLDGIRLLVLVETARGIVNLPDISGSSPRLSALIFGAEDLAGDMGMLRTKEAWEVYYARSAVVTHAVAFGLQAIDMVYVDFKDSAGLAEEAVKGAHMGYSGKQIIHPNQVAPAQDAFSPTDEAIEHALRVLEAYAEHQKSGFGAFAMDGKMVDAPIVKAAERVLIRAKAAGKYNK